MRIKKRRLVWLPFFGYRRFWIAEGVIAKPAFWAEAISSLVHPGDCHAAKEWRLAKT